MRSLTTPPVVGQSGQPEMSQSSERWRAQSITHRPPVRKSRILTWPLVGVALILAASTLYCIGITFILDYAHGLGWNRHNG